MELSAEKFRQSTLTDLVLTVEDILLQGEKKQFSVFKIILVAIKLKVVFQGRIQKAVSTNLVKHGLWS